MKDFNAFFDKYFVNQLPCSFNYGGKPAVFGELQDMGGNDEKRRFVRVMETDRFNATLHIDVLHSSSAVEWWLDVSAPGEYDSDVLDELRYCDFGVELPFIDAAVCTKYPCLHWSRGSRASETDFMPQVENFWPFSNEPFTFGCDFGRTSSGVMPYFNLQTSEESGLIFAIGWSGQWNMSVQRKDTDYKISAIEFKATMDRAKFRVYSGETLSLPRMLVMPWSGMDIEDSFNSFRRLMVKEMPKVNGEKIVPPITISAWGGADAEEHKRTLNYIKERGIDADVYWIDAGWFGAGDECSEQKFADTWYYNVGCWQPLKKLYPDGMEEVGQAVEDAGLKFLLWFELERAVSRHEIVKKHRDYFIGAKLPFTPEAFHEGARTPYSLMLNLGNDEARAYMTELLAEYIEKSKMSWLRIDFNFEPLEYWRYADSEDRWGITEIKYVNGFYAMIDELRSRYPHFAIDNCASGGRRLDYRMTRRAIPLFFTDYLCASDRKLEAMQAENYAVSRWIPVHGACTNESTDYGLRSHLGNTLAFGCDVDPEKAVKKNGELYVKTIEQIKRSRPLMDKDIYLLTELSASKKAWLAYEAYDAEADKGVIFAFRREECPDESIGVRLRGNIRPEEDYRLESADGGEQIVSGRQLMEKCTITIPEQKGSALIFFERANG